MPEIFLYRTEADPHSSTLAFLTFMFLSVARLRLIALSLFTLPLVRSHENVLCEFCSSL